jgi:hypothetical protein
MLLQICTFAKLKKGVGVTSVICIPVVHTAIVHAKSQSRVHSATYRSHPASVPVYEP